MDKITLAEFIDTYTTNGVSFGYGAVELSRCGITGRRQLPFLGLDQLMLEQCRTVEKANLGNNLIFAIRALESITGEKMNINIASLKDDKYAWLQVMDGVPRQAFTHDEMLVHNLYPCTDVEHNGYPVTPIDTCISSIITHISIDAYQKLYFQNGRAAKGMLVIQSDEVDQQTLNDVKLQFQASINNVANSFRTPIFGIGKEDKVQWLSTMGEGAKDSDFAYMYDQISRNILSAFSMSPDELPGYSHLSRGTNSQTLCLCQIQSIYSFWIS